jgi:hypothetical protein
VLAPVSSRDGYSEDTGARNTTHAAATATAQTGSIVMKNGRTVSY